MTDDTGADRPATKSGYTTASIDFSNYNAISNGDTEKTRRRRPETTVNVPRAPADSLFTIGFHEDKNALRRRKMEVNFIHSLLCSLLMLIGRPCIFL